MCVWRRYRRLSVSVENLLFAGGIVGGQQISRRMIAAAARIDEDFTSYKDEVNEKLAAVDADITSIVNMIDTSLPLQMTQVQSGLQAARDTLSEISEHVGDLQAENRDVMACACDVPLQECTRPPPLFARLARCSPGAWNATHGRQLHHRLDDVEQRMGTDVVLKPDMAAEEVRLRAHFGFQPGWTTVPTVISSVEELQAWRDSDPDITTDTCLECKASPPWFLHGPGGNSPGVRDGYHDYTHPTLLSWLRFKFPNAFPIDSSRPGQIVADVGPRTPESRSPFWVVPRMTVSDCSAHVSPPTMRSPQSHVGWAFFVCAASSLRMRRAPPFSKHQTPFAVKATSFAVVESAPERPMRGCLTAPPSYL